MEIYTSGLIIMRGMRQASNRAAKTAISFQCWVQESERGTSASWTDSISTGDYTNTNTHFTRPLARLPLIIYIYISVSFHTQQEVGLLDGLLCNQHLSIKT